MDAKLDEKKVELIKKLHIEGYSQDALAEQFGISQALVSYVLNGKRWNKNAAAQKKAEQEKISE